MSNTDVQEKPVYISCGNCKKTRKHSILFSKELDDEVEDEEGIVVFIVSYTVRLSVCPLCEITNYSRESDDGNITVLWPSKKSIRAGLPQKVESAYKAAQRVRDVDVNSYGVLLGRVLDLICLDQGVFGRTLNDRITSLAKKGIIPDKLAQMAHSLREFRNIGAHATAGELTTSELSLLDSLCEAILEYIYHAPELIAQVEKRVAELQAKTQ